MTAADCLCLNCAYRVVSAEHCFPPGTLEFGYVPEGGANVASPQEKPRALSLSYVSLVDNFTCVVTPRWGRTHGSLCLLSPFADFGRCPFTGISHSCVTMLSPVSPPGESPDLEVVVGTLA